MPMSTSGGSSASSSASVALTASAVWTVLALACLRIVIPSAGWPLVRWMLLTFLYVSTTVATSRRYTGPCAVLATRMSVELVRGLRLVVEAHGPAATLLADRARGHVQVVAGQGLVDLQDAQAAGLQLLLIDLHLDLANRDRRSASPVRRRWSTASASGSSLRRAAAARQGRDCRSPSAAELVARWDRTCRRTGLECPSVASPRMPLTRRSTSFELSLAARSVKTMMTVDAPSVDVDWM